MSNLLSAPDDRIGHTAQKIDSFKKLPVGWHYGRGVPPTEDTVNKALRLNAEAASAGFKKTNAFPGIDGEIQVTAYHWSIYLEMTIRPDGPITFVYEENDTEIEYKELTFDEVVTRLRRFRGITWVSSGLSTGSITTPIRSDSQASPSNLRVMEVVSPSLIRTASSEPVQVFASTSKDFIEMSPERLRFFGIYTAKYFLKIAS